MRISAATVLGITLALSTAWMATGCGNSTERDATPTVASTATPSRSPTVSASPARSPEEEVRVAYLAYWDAYASAVLNLDPSLVAPFAIGEELAGIQQEIEAFRRQGVALRVVVQHTVAVTNVSERSAMVLDRYVNNSFAVDARTKDPPSAPGSGEVIEDVFFLEKVEGRWVVTRSVRQR